MFGVGVYLRYETGSDIMWICITGGLCGFFPVHGMGAWVRVQAGSTGSGVLSGREQPDFHQPGDDHSQS